MAVGNRFNGTGNGRLLLKEKPFGECTHQLSLPATSDFCPNHAPVAADSAAGREGVRSTTMGESRKRTEESLLSSGRFRLSPATGWPGPLPVLFNRLSRHTQVLCFFPCTPRATALRQARVSGGNLQNCAPSAACGGAMTQERNVIPSSPRSCPLSCSSGSAPCSGAKGCAFPAGRCSSAKSPARRQPPFASSPARRPDQSEAA